MSGSKVININQGRYDRWLLEFQEYLRGLNRADETVKKYVNELRNYFRYLSEQNIKFNNITWQEIEDYQVWLIGKKYQRSTVEVKLKAIKRFYEYLLRTNQITCNPTQHIILRRMNGALPKTILSEDEVTQLLNAPDTNSNIGIRDRAILETFYSCGNRLKELCKLNIYDADTSKGFINLDGKGSKDRIVPLGNTACLWIRTYLRIARPEFVNNPEETALFVGVRGKRINHLIVERFIKAYAKQAGISRPVTPHILRHCCATHMVNNGASITDIQKILGHQLLETTQKYLSVVQADIKAMCKKYHPRA